VRLRLIHLLAGAVLAMLAAGCQTVTSTYDRFFGARPVQKPAELPVLQSSITPRILWQGNVGGAEKSIFSPSVSGSVVYAVGAAGQLAGFEATSGRQAMRVDVGQRISGGVGAGAAVVLVGTPKGEVLAFDASGKSLWKAQLSGEVLAPPRVADGVVIARAGDGRIYGLNGADGKRRWLYQRAMPALSVRTHAGVTTGRGMVFAGFPGGRLAAIAVANGNVAWESVVALPRGATELERVADVASLPLVDEQRACAVAYQGRIACFDIASGSVLWARELSSVAGMSTDGRSFYITDDKNAIVALDKTNGSSLWRQDKLAGRGVSGSLAFGRFVVVGDFEGYVHFLLRDDGSFAGRIATDGSAIITAPVALDLSSFVVQTRNGGVFAITVQ
jgi:outer membrane protein assembly factor BamB